VIDAPLIEASGISRRFGEKLALSDVSLRIDRGEVHALLGPNGAGKTTLLRVLSSLVYPSSGSVRVLGLETTNSPRGLRQQLGLVPSGDRSFYLRISGFENLLFFARLHGMRRREAAARARAVLAKVDLAEAADVPVGVYSHGMQKRLSVARALLTDPSILLIDEATHDLDPEGAHRVRGLVSEIAREGAAVVWATQRVDEIRGFAENVTLLHRGSVRFSGSVARLMSHAVSRRYLVQLENGRLSRGELRPALEQALGGLGRILDPRPSDPDHYRLSLEDGAVIGDALVSLAAAEIRVLSCTQERSEIEEAFLSLTTEASE
jgi:ABC-2 type transport system ATP-binding protein